MSGGNGTSCIKYSVVGIGVWVGFGVFIFFFTGFFVGEGVAVGVGAWLGSTVGGAVSTAVGVGEGPGAGAVQPTSIATPIKTKHKPDFPFIFSSPYSLFSVYHFCKILHLSLTLKKALPLRRNAIGSK